VSEPGLDIRDAALRQHYLNYLQALNERRFADLDEFVAEELTYNDRPLTRATYQHDREQDVVVFPDLVYRVGLLVVEGEQVACRLDFQCTPVTTFRGVEPPGHAVAFSEYVFYRFERGRIVAVWSLIDVDAIRQQAAGRA
jgi:predicted ester cyclase